MRSGASDAGARQNAVDSALRYWHARHGNEAVTTKVTDYGCHLEIDIMKNNNVIGSLVYQNGSITER